MTQTTIFQTDLWGNVTIAGDVVDRITYLLKEFPDTRDDYMRLMARYWLMFDGLDGFLGDLPDLQTAFLNWFTACATSPKTLQNRCMEVQRQRPELDASAEVRRTRDAQASAGPVRY